ncbi:MAG TPA: sodium:proton antiporter [Salinisphaera sp.]|nr:sodium:proton antiporter [Salinisphaera sp.]
MTLSVFQLIGILMTLTALFAWCNQRFIGLPSAIGVMLLALAVSLAMQTASWLGVADMTRAGKLVGEINFNHALLDAMLGGLLFAGSMQINLRDLKREAVVVVLLTTIALTASTLLIGAVIWGVFIWLGIGVEPIYCFIFGALISPTDPVAVLAILRQAGVPKTLETQFTGESLFNDAIAIVMFTLLIQIASGTGGAALEPGHVARLFAEEAVGGIAFGILIGGIAFILLRGINEYKVEVIVTLALVTGGYAAAEALHISGPLTVVSAGLLVGNPGRGLAMSSHTREHVDTFWELIDEILNAVLFVLIGLEVLQVPFSSGAIIAGLISIPIILGSRALSVAVPIGLLRLRRTMAPHTIKILTWGGLRGGISVALALSLPAGDARNIIVGMTYIVVVFSIGVQGLTIGRVARLSA